MGADFLVAFLTAGRRKKFDVSAGRAAIDRLRITPLEDWPEDFIDSQIFEVPKDPNEAEAEKHSFIELLSADLHMIEEELSIDGARRRDVWSGTIGSKFVLMSGGMSWGDPPTEAYSSLDRLAKAGITRAMGFDW